MVSEYIIVEHTRLSCLLYYMQPSSSKVIVILTLIVSAIYNRYSYGQTNRVTNRTDGHVGKIGDTRVHM